MEWQRYRDSSAAQPQLSRLINSRLSEALSAIPAGPDIENPLAFLNLVRGWRHELPSGQAVARAMAQTPLSNQELGLEAAVAGSEAPLWFYILKEAELVEGGTRLGPVVGGRIVAEVFIGSAKADPSSFINVDPNWHSTSAVEGGALIAMAREQLELADLVRFSGAGPLQT